MILEIWVQFIFALAVVDEKSIFKFIFTYITFSYLPSNTRALSLSLSLSLLAAVKERKSARSAGKTASEKKDQRAEVA